MKIYNKLVRDKIDEIINNNGKGEKAVVRILSEEEYKKSLLSKLDEEFLELKEAIVSENIKDIIEESADMLEVIRAINGDSLEAVLDTMEQKRENRGGFVSRKFLERVEQEKE